MVEGGKKYRMSDITVKCDDGLVNTRVGSIIMKNGRYLMVGNDRTKLQHLENTVKHFVTDER